MKFIKTNKKFHELNENLKVLHGGLVPFDYTSDGYVKVHIEEIPQEKRKTEAEINLVV